MWLISLLLSSTLRLIRLGSLSLRLSVASTKTIKKGCDTCSTQYKYPSSLLLVRWRFYAIASIVHIATFLLVRWRFYAIASIVLIAIIPPRALAFLRHRLNSSCAYSSFPFRCHSLYSSYYRWYLHFVETNMQTYSSCH